MKTWLFKLRLVKGDLFVQCILIPNLQLAFIQTRVEEFKTALERWQSKFSEAEEVKY